MEYKNLKKPDKKSVIRQDAIIDLSRELSRLLIDNNKLRIENEKLIQSRNELFLQLEKYQGFKRQLRMLLGALYSKLYQKADKLSYPSKYRYPSKIVEQRNTVDAFSKVLVAYDLSVLSEKRILGPRRRRYASIILKKSIELPKYIAKLLLMALRTIKSKLATI